MVTITYESQNVVVPFIVVPSEVALQTIVPVHKKVVKDLVVSTSIVSIDGLLTEVSGHDEVAVDLTRGRDDGRPWNANKTINIERTSV